VHGCKSLKCRRFRVIGRYAHYMKRYSFLIIMALVAVAFVASASHSWGTYHWARTSNPFTVKLGDNVSSAWDSYLGTASSDWSLSSVLNTLIVSGGTDSRRCRATNGRVEVCDSAYGNNNWLGVASIWVSGDHITKGTVKLNNTYFNTEKYDTPAWRQFVMCQEVGHIFGLDHQDETFGNPNLGTCMDYTSDPDGTISTTTAQLSNVHPNEHDYAQLATIYAHLDSSSGGGKNSRGNGKPAMTGGDIDLEHPFAWGKAIKRDARGKNSLYERDLGRGEKVFTFVIWAE
jgi:hypothetical protein